MRSVWYCIHECVCSASLPQTLCIPKQYPVIRVTCGEEIIIRIVYIHTYSKHAYRYAHKYTSIKKLNGPRRWSMRDIFNFSNIARNERMRNAFLFDRTFGPFDPGMLTRDVPVWSSNNDRIMLITFGGTWVIQRQYNRRLRAPYPLWKVVIKMNVVFFFSLSRNCAIFLAGRL